MRITLISKKLLIALIFLLGMPAFAVNQLTLHFIPSPKGIDWRTPQTLARTTLINEIARSPAGGRHAIGHVLEELKCGDFHRYLGMTSSGKNQERDAILKEKVGLGVVLKKYAGRFNDHEEAIQDLAPMHTVGRSNFITFDISESTCKRLMDYIAEYQKRKLDLIYAGLDSLPLRKEGSGCSAFGASFLEIAGLQSNEFEQQWMRHRIVPYKFIGGPITGKKVGLLKIVFARKATWGYFPSDGVKIDFWDPDLMHAWTKHAATAIQTDPVRTFPWPAKVIYREKSEGILFDANNVPTPTGSFFVGE